MAEQNVGAIVLADAKPEKFDNSETVIADCCETRNNYQYMRVGGQWFQGGWVVCKTEGKQVTYHGYASAALCCQNCGRPLNDETPVRRYHAGVFTPIDRTVEALTA